MVDKMYSSLCGLILLVCEGWPEQMLFHNQNLKLLHLADMYVYSLSINSSSFIFLTYTSSTQYWYRYRHNKFQSLVLVLHDTDTLEITISSENEQLRMVASLARQTLYLTAPQFGPAQTKQLLGKGR